MDAIQVNTIIIGGGPAGLASTAACLKRAKIPFVLLEQADHVGNSWRNHYERLKLHTDKRNSHLPYLPFEKATPKYPTRDQFVAYLEKYAASFAITPLLNQQVVRVEQQEGCWLTTTQDRQFLSSHVIVATGQARHPNIPEWPGESSFDVPIIHSSNYTNGLRYKGQKVLVVGFGNSGGEIALDLAEAGAETAVAVRSPVNIIPRDFLGIPILSLSIPMSLLPVWLADLLSVPLLKLTIGDYSRYGLRKKQYGPQSQISRDERIPLIDVGTLKAIRNGDIAVYPGIDQFLAPDTIRFTDGREAAFAAIILATGYKPDVQTFLPAAAQVTRSDGTPEKSGQATALPGLYFCGFYISATGMLREIGIEAKRISRLIQLRSNPNV